MFYFFFATIIVFFETYRVSSWLSLGYCIQKSYRILEQMSLFASQQIFPSGYFVHFKEYWLFTIRWIVIKEYFRERKLVDAFISIADGRIWKNARIVSYIRTGLLRIRRSCIFRCRRIRFDFGTQICRENRLASWYYFITIET